MKFLQSKSHSKLPNLIPFVLNGGQRRAASLELPLSVHVARAWTPLRSLLLDDPVRHIDGFRALHLVEVLAVLRSYGSQTIFALDDSALPDLQSRRFISTAMQGGRVDIKLGRLGATGVVMEQEIYPMPVHVLRGVNSA